MIDNENIFFDGTLHESLMFQAVSKGSSATFSLHGVTIGKEFHWQRQEDQKFAGSLKIIVEKGQLTAINIIGVEDYLLSVISSEMSASASEEFLKAHAVISRSWVMAQIKSSDRRKTMQIPDGICSTPSLVSHLDALLSDNASPEPGETTEYIKWYDHQDHHNFDVCADDHCQRYQGVTRSFSPQVKQAIDATRGQILVYGGEICDARFGKCCGGMTNTYRHCWDNKDLPYLQHVDDPYCSQATPQVLDQVLNDYDRETTDFLEWTVEYSQQEMQELVSENLRTDLGQITDLQDVERSQSGHLSKLKIVGTQKEFTIGKELEIRRTLSRSHLKSSAFHVERLDIVDGIPQRFRLCGRGWGHGVGMSQAGANHMAAEGSSYGQILAHYYPQTTLEKR